MYRDCEELDLVLDQASLYNPESDTYRPDLHITQLFVENIAQVSWNVREPKCIKKTFLPDYPWLFSCVGMF